MQPAKFRTCITVSAAVSLLAFAAFAQQNPREMFQRARMLAESNQNLEAIRLYAQVVAQAKAQRALAANAQYRIGVLYDRLGKKAEAQRVFKIVVSQFADQTEWAGRAQAKIAAAGPNNKSAPKPVVKADTSPANRQYLATFTSLNGQYFSCPAIDSARHRLYVVTQLMLDPAKDPTHKVTPRPGQRYVYEPSTLVVIDTEEHSILKTIPLPNYVVNLAFNPANNKLYASEEVNRHVRVIDTRSFSQYTIPVPGYPGSIAINPNIRKVYVQSQGFAGNDKLFVIDADTNAVTGPIDLNGVAGPVVVNPSTNRVYASAGPRKTRVFNGADNSFLTDLPGIIVRAADPASNRLYMQAVVNDVATTLAIDGNTHNVIASFDFDVGSVAIDTSANRLYAASPTNSRKHQIVAIDTSTNTELGTIAPCERPYFLTLDEATGHFYVCSGDAPPAIYVLAKGALDGEIAEEFLDEFDSPALDPAWTDLNGNYSLTENPGHQRSHVNASSPAKPGTNLFRKFRGDSWTLETKVRYFTGNSGGARSFAIGIGFGSIPFLKPEPTLGYVSVWRHRDDWDNCCPGESGVDFFENGNPASHPLPLNAADAYYLRIRRDGQTVTVESSDDGVNFTTISSHTSGSQIKGLIQYLGINSNTHSNNDAYADFDYVRLTKTRADAH